MSLSRIGWKRGRHCISTLFGGYPPMDLTTNIQFRLGHSSFRSSSSSTSSDSQDDDEDKKEKPQPGDRYIRLLSQNSYSLSDLVCLVANDTDMEQTRVQRVLEATFDRIANSLILQKEVRIHRFGRFSTTTNKPRLVYNIQQQQQPGKRMMKIPMLRRCRFSVSYPLKLRIRPVNDDSSGGGEIYQPYTIKKTRTTTTKREKEKEEVEEEKPAAGGEEPLPQHSTQTVVYSPDPNDHLLNGNEDDLSDEALMETSLDYDDDKR